MVKNGMQDGGWDFGWNRRGLAGGLDMRSEREGAPAVILRLPFNWVKGDTINCEHWDKKQFWGKTKKAFILVLLTQRCL